MNAPTTYANWVAVLERFGNGDDSAIAEIVAGKFVVDAGTAQRFYIRVEEAYKKRKQYWLDRFNRSFQTQSIRNINQLEMIVRNGKQNLLPISTFLSAEGLPEDLRQTLRNDLLLFVEEIKKSMKDHLSRGSKEREKMLLVLNTFGLNELSTAQKAAESVNKKQEQLNNPPSGRTILF